MTIAIDFRGTWTSDPAFWLSFYELSVQAGHTVIMATARQEDGDNSMMQGLNIPSDLPVIFSNGQKKRKACLNAGYEVDIWIDNNPTSIGPLPAFRHNPNPPKK